MREKNVVNMLYIYQEKNIFFGVCMLIFPRKLY
jgi:hypothetical protein